MQYTNWIGQYDGSTITNCCWALSNWNILTLPKKKSDLVEEAKQYHFHSVEVSSTKKSGCGTLDMDGRWKLFYSGADSNSLSAQTGVEISQARLSDCVSDWIPL